MADSCSQRGSSSLHPTPHPLTQHLRNCHSSYCSFKYLTQYHPLPSLSTTLGLGKGREHNSWGRRKQERWQTQVILQLGTQLLGQIRRQLLLGHEILEPLPGKSQVISPQWTGENKEASQSPRDVQSAVKARQGHTTPREERCKLTPCLHEEQTLSCAAPHQSQTHLILAQTAPHIRLITPNGQDKIPYSLLRTGRAQTSLALLGRNPRCQWGEKSHTERW